MDWNPVEIIKEYSEAIKATSLQYAVILLNQPIHKEEKFVSVWNKALFRVSVDGGGNRWDVVRKKFPNLVYPDVVSGDFDSIRKEVLDMFKENETVEIVPTMDQDETDFTKAVRVLSNKIEESKLEITQVITFCEVSGRFDQIIANIETLYHSLNILPDKQIVIMGSSSLTWLLPAGSHKIHCGRMAIENFKILYCSIIPMGSPSEITTSGLKWNLQNDTLAFGKLVSTSNEIDYGDDSNDDHIVTIDNSNPVLWSMEFELYSQV